MRTRFNLDCQNDKYIEIIGTDKDSSVYLWIGGNTYYGALSGKQLQKLIDNLVKIRDKQKTHKTKEDSP